VLSLVFLEGWKERIKGEKVWDKNRNRKEGKKKRGKKEWNKEIESRDGEEEKNRESSNKWFHVMLESL
jgi:hypothetical protein